MSLEKHTGAPAGRVGVRRAEYGDIPALCQVQSRAMLAGLEAALGTVPEVVRTLLSPQAMIGPWTQALNEPGEDSVVLVSFEDDTITGMAAFSPPEPIDLGGLESGIDGGTDSGTGAHELLTNPAQAEISALEVDTDFTRRGHGSRLLAALTDLLRAGGVKRVQAWSLAKDRTKDSFLRSAGFAPAPIRRGLAVGQQVVDEQLWYTDL